MNGIALWNAIRHRLGLPALRQHRVTVQHLMLAEPDLRCVQAALDPVGRRLGVQFVLQGHAGDIVLLDADLSGRISPQLVHALVEDRPTVLLGSLQRPEVAALDATQQQALREQELQRQLLGIGLVRRHSAKPDAAHWHRSGLHAVAAQTGAPQARPVVAADSDFDPTFDSRIDAQQLAAATLLTEQTALLAQVQRGLGDPGTPALAASYGPDAHLHFNFSTGLVCIDPLALQHLRVRRDVPLPAAGVRPDADSAHHELQDVVWSLGLASGHLALMGAPADWWHTPLQCTGLERIERYSRVPQHLDMARRLQAGALTPSELRRQACVGVAELRRFLQACLALQLLQWPRALTLKEAA